MASYRKSKLNDNSAFLQFNWKADVVESWIGEYPSSLFSGTSVPLNQDETLNFQIWISNLFLSSIRTMLSMFLGLFLLCPLPFDRAFSRDVTAAMLVFQTKKRRPYWCSKQRNGGHIGVPNQSSGNWIYIYAKFVLVSVTWMKTLYRVIDL